MVDVSKSTTPSEEKHIFAGTPEKEGVESTSAATSKIAQGGINAPGKEQPIAERKNADTPPLEKISVVVPKMSSQPSEKSISLENDLEELISGA